MEHYDEIQHMTTFITSNAYYNEIFFVLFAISSKHFQKSSIVYI